jgi:hypothetical protein
VAFTETTNQGWLSRLGNAIIGVVVGLVLIPVSVFLLFWNEGRAVHTARTLAEGKSAVVTVDGSKVDPADDGKLIHFTAPAKSTGDKLADSAFHVSADAIHLRRKVMMYEWTEEKHTESHNNAVGGGSSNVTTYSYSQGWNDHPISSAEFRESGHSNPTQWRVEGKMLDASPVTAGAFTLNSELVGKIDNFTPVSITSDLVNGLPDDLKGGAIFSDNAVLISNDAGQKPDPASPRVGDMKVSFEAALPGDVSVIAQQSGSNVTPYQTKNNALELLYVGTHSADEMFKSEQVKNSQITWIIRGAGFIAMWIGLAMLLNPLKVLSDVIGIVGDIVGAGIGIITGLIAVAVTFVTVAIAWIAYRPIVGIGMLVIAGGAVALFLMLRSKAAARRAAIGTGQVAMR